MIQCLTSHSPQSKKFLDFISDIVGEDLSDAQKVTVFLATEDRRLSVERETTSVCDSSRKYEGATHPLTKEQGLEIYAVAEKQFELPKFVISLEMRFAVNEIVQFVSTFNPHGVE